MYRTVREESNGTIFRRTGKSIEKWKNVKKKPSMIQIKEFTDIKTM
jgi:hypothetical protein